MYLKALVALPVRHLPFNKITFLKYLILLYTVCTLLWFSALHFFNASFFPSSQDRLKAESLNKHLHRELTDYQAPDITEYMNAKDKQKKLQHSIHTWERKVGIAEVNGYFDFLQICVSTERSA